MHVSNKELAFDVHLPQLLRGYTFDELAIQWNKYITQQTASSYGASCKDVLLNTFCKKSLFRF